MISQNESWDYQRLQHDMSKGSLSPFLLHQQFLLVDSVSAGMASPMCPPLSHFRSLGMRSIW